MADPLDRLRRIGVCVPVMQAGMPAIARAELAAAVARAGGIGTVGLTDVSTWNHELQKARQLAGDHPLCANLLLPMTRQRHVEILIEQKISMATLFWGHEPEMVRQLKENGVFVFQQVGSADEAELAWKNGVDLPILQGQEAGGHVRSAEPLAELLSKVAARSDGRPVFAAGGMNTAEDVRRAVDLGASGVSSGTRFVLTHESCAHDAYKEKLLDADSTVLTKLFGMTWSALHRVVPNQATERWCGPSGEIPGWLERINEGSEIARNYLPMKTSMATFQRPSLPFFTPSHPVQEHPARMIECSALYAGQHVGQLGSLCTAAEAVEELAKGLS